MAGWWQDWPALKGKTMIATNNPERLPQALADTLDTLAQQHTEDRDVYRTLAAAREALRVLSWNRFAARHEHADKAFHLRRRHQGHTRARLDAS
jgi:hypothetical protein